MKKNRFVNKKEAILNMKNKVLPKISVATMLAAMMIGTVSADAAALMNTVINIIAKLAIVPAGVMVITGVIQYASAHSDGDGPATKKAINMLSAGVMLALVSAILLVLASNGTFSSMITT